jgi:hypothetical protein
MALKVNFQDFQPSIKVVVCNSYFLSNFFKTNASVELEMDVNNKTKVIKALKNNNEVDFALVSAKDLSRE